MAEFIKYHKIKRLGDLENRDIFLNPEDEIIREEKVDGGNFRTYINNAQPIFGSRTRELDESNDNVNNFRKCIEFVKDKLKDKDLSKYEGYVIFGECCIKHTISYDWEKIPPFLGFDIHNGERYLSFEEVELIFKELDLPMVPVVNKCLAKDIVLPLTDDMVPESKYCLSSAVDKKAEGIVFKNYERQLFAKYVRDAFKEKNSEMFGGSPKYNKVDDTDNSEFVFKYCTNARIEKLILKKIDSGEQLSMSLMGSIIKETYVDIVEEEWREILLSNWKLDFKNIRKLVAKRCKALLEQMVENNVIINRGK